MLNLNKEPAVIINGLSGLLQQVLPLLVVVGLVELSGDKLAAWVAIIGLVMAFISTALIRQNVVSPKTANEQIQIAIDSPSNITVAEVIAEQEAKKESDQNAKT